MSSSPAPAALPAATSNGEGCHNCRFGTAEGAMQGQIVCRRYPPTMLVAQSPSQPVATGSPKASSRPSAMGVLQSTQGVLGHFPMMDATVGWCGEWSPKREAMH